MVSQQPDAIRAFSRALGGQIVAKKLVGSGKKATVSVLVKTEDLSDDASILLCPAIYQEYIKSNEHLRINCFGDSIHATYIKTDIFDWRRKLDALFAVYHNLTDELKAKLSRFLELAGLRMGIMDMVIPEDGGEPVWLEVNPQGQFLFCEGLTKYDLTNRFADFLISEAKRSGLGHQRQSF